LLLEEVRVKTPHSSEADRLTSTNSTQKMYTDWNACGCTSAPVDQGDCNADYAFAAVGALESAYQIALMDVLVPWPSKQTALPAGCNSQPFVAGSV